MYTYLGFLSALLSPCCKHSSYIKQYRGDLNYCKDTYKAFWWTLHCLKKCTYSTISCLLVIGYSLLLHHVGHFWCKFSLAREWVTDWLQKKNDKTNILIIDKVLGKPSKLSWMTYLYAFVVVAQMETSVRRRDHGIQTTHWDVPIAMFS